MRATLDSGGTLAGGTEYIGSDFTRVVQPMATPLEPVTRKLRPLKSGERPALSSSSATITLDAERFWDTSLETDPPHHAGVGEPGRGMAARHCASIATDAITDTTIGGRAWRYHV